MTTIILIVGKQIKKLRAYRECEANKYKISDKITTQIMENRLDYYLLIRCAPDQNIPMGGVL